MTPDDIAAVEVTEELDLSADGATAVVVRRSIARIRRGGNSRLVYESHLFLVDVATGRSRRLTSGPVRDSQPRISPDCSTVAFLRSDPVDNDLPPKLCLFTITTGRVRTVAPIGSLPGHGAISSVEWSPDGSRLAFVAEVDPPRFIVGDRPPVGSAASRSSKLPTPVARRVVTADWRWDEVGHCDYWSHLFVVDVSRGSRPRQVTRGDWGVAQITWHPNGRRIAFVSDRSAQRDVRPRPSVWHVAVDARQPRPLCVIDAGWGASRPAYSPDGRWVAAVGILDADVVDDVAPGLLLARSDGSSPPRALAPELDRPIGNWNDTDLTGWMVSGRYGPVWRDTSTIVAVVTDRGRALPEVWRIDARSGELLAAPVACEREAEGPWADAVTHVLAVAAGATRAVTLSTLHGEGLEVHSVELDVPPAQRRFRTLTSFGTRWQRRFAQPEMRRVEAPGPGGPIETWIASPPGAADEALPTVVAIHGGPLGGWAPAPHVETIVLVNAGFRVVCPNIRGGAGYGRHWIRPQLGDWGGVDADDVHAALDHAIALGLVDPARVGVFGLSYGGFMVNWLVGTTDRFAAAVSENGVTNQVSAWANSDGGPDYCRLALMGDTFTPEGVALLWKQSPLRNVANVHTPLLLLQGEADVRCPAQDNEQFFVALRHLGRTVEYVLYPDSYHTFAYSGRPDRRIDRMHRVSAWFTKHLMPNPTPV